MIYVFLVIAIIITWLSLGTLAYFHRVMEDVERSIRTYPPFYKDAFFYDSLLHGLIAFYFEFLYRKHK